MLHDLPQTAPVPPALATPASNPRHGLPISSLPLQVLPHAPQPSKPIVAPQISPHVSHQPALPLHMFPHTASQSAALTLSPLEFPPDFTPTFLVLDLFTGMDGLGHAFHQLQLDSLVGQVILILFFETDSRCRRLLSRRCRQGAYLSPWKDASGCLGSVFWLYEGGLGLILQQFPSIKDALVAGGSPCVGFSRARHSAGLGINDPQSNKMWILPVLTAMLCDILQGLVLFILENVVPDSHLTGTTANINSTMGVPALAIDADTLCAASRPRLFWQNLRTTAPPSNPPPPSSALREGWAPLSQLLNRPPRPWATFLRPFKAGQPREFPRPYPRLPLHCYSLRGLAYNTSASAADLQAIRDWVPRSVDNIPSAALRKAGTPGQRARGSLVDWIHLEGGHRILRPLLHDERDRALGFPGDASSLPDDPIDPTGFSWGALEASGNTFAVPVIAFLLKPLADLLLHGTTFTPLAGRPRVTTPQAALQALGASSEDPLNAER